MAQIEKGLDGYFLAAVLQAMGEFLVNIRMDRTPGIDYWPNGTIPGLSRPGLAKEKAILNQSS